MAKDLAVFRLRPLGDNRYRMEFGIGRLPKTVAGVQKLAQHIVMQLLQTPGSDPDDPGAGGGLDQLVRTPLSIDEAELMQANLQIAISRVEDSILDGQEDQPLPSDERLQALEVEEITLDEVTVEWTLRLRLVTEAGTKVSLDISDLLVRS